MRQAIYLHLDPLRIFEEQSSLCFEFAGQQVRLTGSGCGGLSEGWRVELLFSGLSPILVLQLAHSGGDRSVWYVDSDGSRLAGSIDDLDYSNRQLLRHTALSILCPFARSLLQDAKPVLEPVIRDFLCLDLEIKKQVFSLVQDVLFPQPKLCQIKGNFGSTLMITQEGTRQAVLKHEYLAAILQRNLQDMLLEAIRSGRTAFEVPSPFSGEPLEVQASVCFDDFHFLYRFVDSSSDLVFYLVAGYELSKIYAVYFPQINSAFCLTDQAGLGDLFARHLPSWLSNHLICFGQELARYLQHPIACVTSMVRAPPWTHIGHQLWNELTGIEHLLTKTSIVGNLEWIVPDGDRAVEFYGPIDALFPQLISRVQRGLRDADEGIRYTYANSRLAVRITRDFVSNELRSRILEHAVLSARMRRSLRPIADDANNNAGPVILLGLRVENRTLIDLKGFYSRVIEETLSIFPTTRFVIDGHNVPEAGKVKYTSHGERSGDFHLITSAEYGVLNCLTDVFGTTVIIDSVGLTIPENLLLINQCDFFVSLWGAGLAKYRWVCNKPGFVITSRWNLLQRADLRIYDHPAFLEKPTPLHWIDPAFITDHPEAPCIVATGNHPQWSNFSIQEHPVIGQIVKTLSEQINRL